MKRKILTLCLVLALILSLALPAFAYKNGSGVNIVNGTPYMYSYNASYTSKQASCSMLYDYVSVLLRCEITSVIRSGSDYYSDYGVSSGYASISTSASNISNTGNAVSGTVVGYDATFYMAGSYIDSLSE